MAQAANFVCLFNSTESEVGDNAKIKSYHSRKVANGPNQHRTQKNRLTRPSPSPHNCRADCRNRPARDRPTGAAYRPKRLCNEIRPTTRGIVPLRLLSASKPLTPDIPVKDICAMAVLGLPLPRFYRFPARPAMQAATKRLLPDNKAPFRSD